MKGKEPPETDDDRVEAAASLLAELEREMRETPVAEHIRSMLATLSTLALQRLGKAKGSEETRDLRQAHLAIESFRALSEALISSGQDANAEKYREILATMELTFVRELGQPEGKEEATGGDKPAGPAGDEKEKSR